jgi:putative sigma-54 modulation protein
MNIQITTRHESHISDETRAFIEAEVEHLGQFYDKISSAHMICDREEHKAGQEDTVELILGVEGNNLSAKATEENLGKAIDAVMEKMTRQLKKKNEKIKAHK